MAEKKPLPVIAPECLSVIDDQVTTTSLDVARIFGRQHKNILQSIDSLATDVPSEFYLLNFQQGSYTMPETSDQQHRMYTMTRDGFTLLAMGFTGKRAMQFKVAYIDAFNRMEEALLQEKIWVAGLTQALEHVCPTPPTEADTIRNQRAMKTLRAQTAYWAMLEDMPFSAAESAVCAVGKLRKLDDLDLKRHPFGEIFDFLERVIIHSNKDTQPATEEQITTIKCLLEACTQFRYSRDRDIYNLLLEEYGVSIETIMNATSGEAKRIAGIAYNLLHQHLAQTLTINEIKRRVRKEGSKFSDSEELPPPTDDNEEQP
ncbi:MAG: Rha family transcriptional regulator [Desulfobulbus sp.]|jgi:Rha family phage regulatory protein